MVVHFDGTDESASSESESPESRRLDPVKGAFLAGLNHEFRTPLSGIIGMLDLLAETSLDPEQKEYIEAAQLCSESLAELLNATLRYSALEAGQSKLEKAEFSLKSVTEAAVERFRKQAEAKGIKLYLTQEAGLPETLYGVGDSIRELLEYLIANAVKFTNQGSVEVRVSVHPPQNQSILDEAGDPELRLLRFIVKDTGIGIPGEKLEGIFDSFQQGEDGLARNYPGLGLGLALTRKLVELLEGSITVESELGSGSAFTVTMPVQLPRRELAEYRNTSLKGMVVLAVDDNPVGLRVLRHFLQRRNVRVITASSGPEAVAAVTEYQPDLILMDLQMPGMDGLEATSQIRSLEGCQGTPIIALTANTSEQVRKQCLDRGMQGFLTKPVDSDELGRAVRRYAGS